MYYALGERGGTWRDTYWHGVRVRKCPLDLWVYQELLHELRPDLIVETGTAYGGSALYLAHMCDLLGQGEVVTVDAAQHPDRPKHGRIE
ncbi:MAG TPA: CmcI family methyltransferase, partial [Chloroflexota bacterium]|nr:CmcI family methyltransferase [Chloroflexota bacterium]